MFAPVPIPVSSPSVLTVIALFCIEIVVVSVPFPGILPALKFSSFFLSVVLKTATLLAVAPLTATLNLPSVPAEMSTLLASEGGLVPCNSE